MPQVLTGSRLFSFLFYLSDSVLRTASDFVDLFQLRGESIGQMSMSLALMLVVLSDLLKTLTYPLQSLRVKIRVCVTVPISTLLTTCNFINFRRYGRVISGLPEFGNSCRWYVAALSTGNTYLTAHRAGGISHGMEPRKRFA
jgi:hypothetical protein